MLLRHDVVAGRQAKTSAFASRLGREERLEKFVPDVLGTRAVVLYAHFHGVCGGTGGDLQHRHESASALFPAQH